MGLDMYLIARRQVYPWMRGMEPVYKKLARSVKKTLEAPKANWKDAGITVSIEVGYWRKANAIHGWIVKNVQNGVDECQESYFSREKMEELLETCKKTLADLPNAGDLLPPTSGFFFGSMEMDEFYAQDLKHTIEILENVLEDKSGLWLYYYHASW